MVRKRLQCKAQHGQTGWRSPEEKDPDRRSNWTEKNQDTFCSLDYTAITKAHDFSWIEKGMDDIRINLGDVCYVILLHHEREYWRSVWSRNNEKAGDREEKTFSCSGVKNYPVRVELYLCSVFRRWRNWRNHYRIKWWWWPWCVEFNWRQFDESCWSWGDDVLKWIMNDSEYGREK